MTRKNEIITRKERYNNEEKNEIMQDVFGQAPLTTTCEYNVPAALITNNYPPQQSLQLISDGVTTQNLTTMSCNHKEV